jgi:hypothetical protein
MMVKEKKTVVESKEEVVSTPAIEVTKLTPNDIGWTDHVLSLLSDDEKIAGNPTTDGLRRIFEIALNCDLIESTSDVTQVPTPENEKRATVVHRLSYFLKDETLQQESKFRTVSGSADVYWGNCDKTYRNHPTAVAETRAEGRALRRALKLRKVVAAEEIAKDIEDHPDENSVSKISVNQINFIDVIAQRLNINVILLISQLAITESNIYNISHENAVGIIKQLTAYQQDMNKIPSDLLGYQANWK